MLILQIGHTVLTEMLSPLVSNSVQLSKFPKDPATPLMDGGLILLFLTVRRMKANRLPTETVQLLQIFRALASLRIGCFIQNGLSINTP